MNSKLIQKVLFASFVSVFVTFGCAMGDEGTPTASTIGVDADGDGYIDVNDNGNDCNDKDARIHPGANEICDGKDNNCDGNKDEGDVCICKDGDTSPCDCSTTMVDGTMTCTDNAWGTCSSCKDKDADGDGYPSTVYGGTDCDDTNKAINPGATEVCDGKDNNCKDGIDEGGVCTVAECTGSATTSCASECSSGSGTKTCSNGKWGSCVCQPTDECTGTTSVSCGSECASGNGTKTCSNGKWGSCSCTTVVTGPKPCASMPNVTEWETVTLVAYAPEASTVRFEGMCGVYDSSLKKWTASSDYTVIPGCEAKSGSGGTFTCTTKRPKGWNTFEGNNYLNNGYWSVGVLTLSEAQAVCPSSYNSTTKTCNDLWSVMSKHGDYSINGVACKTSINWVENGNSDSFNCRVTN